MPTLKKLVLYGVGALVVLAAVLYLALNREYDSPELGRKLLAYAGESGGIQVEAEGFRLSPLKGLTLTGVTAVADLPAGALAASADRVVLEHDLSRFLSGEVLVNRIVLERPQIELGAVEASVAPEASGGGGGVASTSDAASESEGESATTEEGGGRSLTLRIRQLAVVDGSMVLLPEEGVEGAQPTEIQGLDLELRELTVEPGSPQMLTGLSATGEMRADAFNADALRATEVEGVVKLEGGHFLLTDLQLPAPEGSLTVSDLDLDLTTDPYTYQLEMSGDPLNTNRIMGWEKEEGGFGPGLFTFELTGDGSESGNLAGRGTLSFATGELPGVPVLAAIEQLLAGTAVVGSDYEPFAVNFRVVRDRLEVEPFTVHAGELRLTFGGEIGLDDVLRMNGAFQAPQEVFAGIKEIPKEVLEAFTDEEGKIRMPLAIAGSSVAPEVGFDRTEWQRMAGQRLRQEAEQEIGRQLGKLFSRALGGEEESEEENEEGNEGG